jgi:hypothetical protein
MIDVTAFREVGTTAGFGVPQLQERNDCINTINRRTIQILNGRLTETSPVLKHPSVPFESEKVIEIAPTLEYPYEIFNLKNYGSTYELNYQKKINELENSKIFLFKRIKWKKNLFELKHPIDVTRNFRDGLWTLYDERLEILVIASDLEQCKKDFQEEFCILWEEYANTPDDKLSLDGQKLKYKLREIIEGVGIED